MLDRKNPAFPRAGSSVRSRTTCCIYPAYRLLKKQTLPLGILGMVSHFLATGLSSVSVFHTGTFLKKLSRNLCYLMKLTIPLFFFFFFKVDSHIEKTSTNPRVTITSPQENGKKGPEQ